MGGLTGHGSDSLSTAELVEATNILDSRPCQAHITMGRSAERSLLERQQILYRPAISPQMRRLYRPVNRPRMRRPG